MLVKPSHLQIVKLFFSPNERGETDIYRTIDFYRLMTTVFDICSLIENKEEM